MTDLLYFVGSFAAGGTERHLSQVLPSLARRGWSVEAVTLTGGGPFAAPLEAAGIPIVTLPRGRTGRIPKVRGALALARQTSMLASLLRRRPPRLLHCFLPTCCQIGALAAQVAGFRPILMSRRSQAARPSLFPGDKALERWAISRADLVFGHSAAVVEELSSEGVPNDRLVLNHNGIDVAEFDRSAGDRWATRGAEGWGPELVFAVVANLIPYKGHVDLLRAFGKLAPMRDSWRLVLAGQGSPQHETALRTLARELGIADRVGFLGVRADIPRLLRAADVGVLVSHQEGFPNAVLEYMAAGLPVIATAVGGNPDAVEHGITGLLVPPASPDELAVAAETILSSASLGCRLGAAGRAKVEESFSLEACVTRYERVYSELLERSVDQRTLR